MRHVCVRLCLSFEADGSHRRLICAHLPSICAIAAAVAPERRGTALDHPQQPAQRGVHRDLVEGCEEQRAQQEAGDEL